MTTIWPSHFTPRHLFTQEKWKHVSIWKPYKNVHSFICHILKRERTQKPINRWMDKQVVAGPHTDLSSSGIKYVYLTFWETYTGWAKSRFIVVSTQKSLFFFLLIWERQREETREEWRETETSPCCSTYSLTSVPCMCPDRIEPTTLAYWDDLTNWASWPGSEFILVLLFINYWIIFNMRNCKPMIAPPCMPEP